MKKLKLSTCALVDRTRDKDRDCPGVYIQGFDQPVPTDVYFKRDEVEKILKWFADLDEQVNGSEDHADAFDEMVEERLDDLRDD